MSFSSTEWHLSLQYDFDIHPTYTYLAMEKLVEEGLLVALEEDKAIWQRQRQ